MELCKSYGNSKVSSFRLPKLLHGEIRPESLVFFSENKSLVIALLLLFKIRSMYIPVGSGAVSNYAKNVVTNNWLA